VCGCLQSSKKSLFKIQILLSILASPWNAILLEPKLNSEKGFNSKYTQEKVLRQVQIVRRSLPEEISRSKVIVVETAVDLTFLLAD